MPNQTPGNRNNNQNGNNKFQQRNSGAGLNDRNNNGQYKKNGQNQNGQNRNKNFEMLNGKIYAEKNNNFLKSFLGGEIAQLIKCLLNMKT